MKKRISWIAAALLVALPLAAQKTAKEAEHSGDPAAYQKILQPGEHHRLFDPLVGSWKADLRVWLHGTPPPEAKALDTLEVRWILDGRFLEGKSTMEIRPDTGPVIRVEGNAVMGYNVAQKRFFRLHVTDTDTRQTYSQGIYIPAKKALIFRGTEDDPVTGDSFEKMDVFTFLDEKDRFRYELFYIMGDGSQIKAAEGYYVRRKE